MYRRGTWCSLNESFVKEDPEFTGPGESTKCAFRWTMVSCVVFCVPRSVGHKKYSFCVEFSELSEFFVEIEKYYVENPQKQV